MGHLRTLKNGDTIVVYTSRDRKRQAERIHLHKMFYRDRFSFNAARVKANVEACIRIVAPSQNTVIEWMEDLQETQELLREKIHNTMRLEQTGILTMPIWPSGKAADCRIILTDTQERIRMVREIGKQLGVSFS